MCNCKRLLEKTLQACAGGLGAVAKDLSATEKSAWVKWYLWVDHREVGPAGWEKGGAFAGGFTTQRPTRIFRGLEQLGQIVHKGCFY